ncbi:MAG: cation-translocating P-type ATPase C-terminal domain-containing protein, partial [Candidatus Gracilibacteria bacterium]
LILCVDLGTDVLPAIALGVDKADPDIMESPPRNPKERILNKKFIIHFVYLGIFIGSIVTFYFYLTLNSYGGETSYLKASTSAFVLLVFIQMWNAINSRSFSHSIFKIGFFKNPHLIGAIAISIIVVFAMVQIPFLQKALGTTGLNTLEWLMVIGASSLVFVLEELRKILFKGKFTGYVGMIALGDVTL